MRIDSISFSPSAASDDVAIDTSVLVFLFLVGVVAVKLDVADGSGRANGGDRAAAAYVGAAPVSFIP